MQVNCECVLKRLMNQLICMSQKGVFFVILKEISPVVSFHETDRNLLAGNLCNMAFVGGQVIVHMKS